MKLAAAASFLLVVAAGCGTPAPTPDGPQDFAAHVASLEIGIDAPSSGGAGYRVDLTVRALSENRGESYAWAGNLTMRFVPSGASTAQGSIRCPGQGVVVETRRTVALGDFDNPIGAGDHWILPVSVQDARFADGHYDVTVTANFARTGAVQVATGEFAHCAAT